VETRKEAWGFSFREVIHMSHLSHEFVTAQQRNASTAELLPLYEAKMVHHFDHRWSGFTLTGAGECEVDRANPSAFALPRYWVPRRLVDERLGPDWTRNWCIGWRDITNTTNERTAIFCVIPRAGMGHTMPLALVKAELSWLLPACASAFIADYATRQRLAGTHLTMNVLRQIPFPTPAQLATACPWAASLTFADFFLPRVLELTYTAWDLEAFAQDCGWSGPPFRWDEERRFLLRCELDAAFFHLYLGPEAEWRQQPAALTQSFPTPRDAVSYIMDTFPIVKRKDEEKFNGDYRTKRTILEIYDALAEAMKTGTPYQTRLNPPPADPRCCHPTKS